MPAVLCGSVPRSCRARRTACPGGTAEISIDRVNMPTQRLETALRVPLGEPVLVGGMTFPESGAADNLGSSRQLYLILEVQRDSD